MPMAERGVYLSVFGSPGPKLSVMIGVEKWTPFNRIPMYQDLPVRLTLATPSCITSVTRHHFPIFPRFYHVFRTDIGET